jgi:predicted AAA+ superfamily ATPase
MYSARTLEGYIRKAATQFPVLLLTGARQVGKTTLLRHLGGGERIHVCLDDPLVLSLAREDPALFMQRFPAPVLIDEIQYAPQLLPYIKMAVDTDRKPGSFWLTGSQQFQLMRNVSESLAGRVAVLQLLGLSRREIVGDGAAQKPFLPTTSFFTERARQADTLSLKDLGSSCV